MRCPAPGDGEGPRVSGGVWPVEDAPNPPDIESALGSFR